MKIKPVIPRARAHRDVDDAIDHHLREAGEAVALGFVDSLDRAYTDIGRHPSAGAAGFAHELDLPGLRSWPLTRYPYLIFFYVERDDHIDVWRVLQDQRDVPAEFRTGGPRGRASR